MVLVNSEVHSQERTVHTEMNRYCFVEKKKQTKHFKRRWRQMREERCKVKLVIKVYK